MLEGVEIVRGEICGRTVFPVVAGNPEFPTNRYAFLSARKGNSYWNFGFDPDSKTEDEARAEFEERIRKELSAWLN